MLENRRHWDPARNQLSKQVMGGLFFMIIVVILGMTFRSCTTAGC